MAALTQDQLAQEINELNDPALKRSAREASEAVRISRLILITHRVQDFAGSDAVALAGLILEGAADDAR